MRLITMLRSAIHGPDVKRAREQEATVLSRERTRGSALIERIEGALASGDDSRPAIGTSSATGRPIRISRERLLGHWSLVGPSGAGKSYLLIKILESFFAAGVRRGILLDPKSETVELTLRLILSVARLLPDDEAERLLDSVVYINLFSLDALPLLQVLASSDAGDAELLAFEVARLVTHELTVDVGVRQEIILAAVLRALILARLPLTCLPAVFREPELLDSLADSGISPEELRLIARRIREESRERVLGIQCRIESLLRLKATRLAMGGAATALDVGKLLEQHIACVDLAAPAGSDDISRVLRGILWSKLTRAIRARPNGGTPCFVAVDEAPTFLAAGGVQTASDLEDSLRLARARRSYLLLCSQDMVSIGKISPTLPSVLKVNAHWHALFRSRDDWSPALPVTGTRPRPKGPAWEASRPGYLDRGAEREALREEFARLPDREMLLIDSRTGQPGLFVRTANVELTATDAEVQALRARASQNAFVRPVADLEQGLRAVEERLAALRARVPKSAATAAGTGTRRGTRPVELG